MLETSNIPGSRVLVVGLDGATWAIARPLMAAGRMPNLARLVAQGAAGSLASTVPPISAAAWVSFLTGQNPGRHGVYQFRKFDLRNYSGYRDEFATSNDYVGRSFLELAGQRGRTVGAVGIPMTYPPFPVNGFLVSGFPRPFGPTAQVYPPEMADRLGKWDAVQDSFNFSLSGAKTVETSDYWVRRYTEISLAALAEQDYDLFLVVWNSTDNIPHLFWKYTDPSFPAYDAEGAGQFGDVINHQYEVADGEIGKLLAALPNPDNTTVVVMSDHGMGPYPHLHVHLNAWLASQGLLAVKAGSAGQPGIASRAVSMARKRLPAQWRHRLRDRLPVGMRTDMHARHMNVDQIDWSRTEAYRFKIFPSVEGIVINMRGRQASGIVEPGDGYDALCDRLVADLDRPARSRQRPGHRGARQPPRDAVRRPLPRRHPRHPRRVEHRLHRRLGGGRPAGDARAAAGVERVQRVTSPRRVVRGARRRCAPERVDRRRADHRPAAHVDAPHGAAGCFMDGRQGDHRHLRRRRRAARNLRRL
ncbi:MAG: alkaline phosphatase family protein [Caldilineales bacterium]